MLSSLLLVQDPVGFRTADQKSRIEARRKPEVYIVMLTFVEIPEAKLELRAERLIINALVPIKRKFAEPSAM